MVKVLIEVLLFNAKLYKHPHSYAQAQDVQSWLSELEKIFQHQDIADFFLKWTHCFSSMPSATHHNGWEYAIQRDKVDHVSLNQRNGT